MNWLDLALSAPTIGIVCEPRLQFPHEMLDDLRPALEKWKKDHSNLLFYNPAPTALIQIKVGDGFVCDLLGNGFNTTFKYETKVVDTPAALPTLTTPDVLKFSDLLTRAIELTATIFERLKAPPVLVTRIGIVADCRLDEKDLPPGIERFLSYLGAPWGAKPSILSGTMTFDLPKHEKWTRRCHHMVDREVVERPGDLRIRLDWQMSLEKGSSHRVAEGAAKSFVEDAAGHANAYFEKFAAGGLNYGAL